jgi:hypothetical protein
MVAARTEKDTISSCWLLREAAQGRRAQRETDRMKTSPRAPFDLPSSISSVLAS